MHCITYLISSLLLISISTHVFCQDNRFFIPREIKQAYENGSRSLDGKPGDKYWQNQVNYNIDVTIQPSTREVIGSETITYFNNSPDDLNRLIIRLYQDNFKEGNERAFSVNEEDINDGVEISKLVIDGDSLDVEETTIRNGTNMTVNLPQAILSNSSASIEIDWRFVIPSTRIRMGEYDSTSFFIAYWFPQVAVYDDVRSDSLAEQVNALLLHFQSYQQKRITYELIDGPVGIEALRRFAE